MSELSLSSRKTARSGFTLIELLVVIAIIAILAAIIIPAVMAVQGQAQKAKDLEQVRGMGNGITLYYKKYSYFPALVNMSATTTNAISVPRKQADEVAEPTLSLKLLMKGGYVEDPKTFFCPRDASPTDKTLSAMTANLDPLISKVWACSYAYDAGHNPNHGAVPFYGNRKSMVQLLSNDTLHVLTCEQVAKEMEFQSGKGTTGYVFSNHAVGATASTDDDVYVDEETGAGTYGWRDSFLVDAKTVDIP